MKKRIITLTMAFLLLLNLSNVSSQAQLTDPEFYVLTLSGKYIVLPYDPTFTIEYVKYMIQCREGISKDYQKLYYAGKYLEDGRCLSDYNIQKYSKLSLVIRYYSRLWTY